MVRAILDGSKTQTRRVVRDGEALGDEFARKPHPCPYGQPGDRLWVREACAAKELSDKEAEREFAAVGGQAGGLDHPRYGQDGVYYPADGSFVPIENNPDSAAAWGDLHDYAGKQGATVPSIHMPRWACRLLLEITDVRVQRVQEISEEDAYAEGAPEVSCDTYSAIHEHPQEDFQVLWDSINAKRGYGWDTNPWVWCISFKRIDA